MKKLLTVLLTLVMAVCLANLNYNHTKADESNTDYSITYIGGGYDSNPQISENVFYKGEKLTFYHTTNRNFTVVDPYGVSHSINDSSGNYTYTIEHSGTYSEQAGSTFTIKDPEIVQCQGLKYQDAGEGPNWYNGTDTTPLDTTSGANNVYGIKKVSDGVYKFTKELTITTNRNDINTLNLWEPITIILDKNVSLAQTNNMACIGMNDTATNSKIIGNGHTLTLTSNDYRALFWHTKLTLESITLIAKNNSLTTPTFGGNSDLVLEGDCNIDITNANANGAPLILQGTNLKIVSNQTPMGNTTGEPEEVELRKLAYGNNYAYALKSSTPGSSILATHVLLTNVAPKPDPTPSEPVVKDESCEKVIGPTWHWNNDKGICEDYGVVGTSTR